MQYIIHRKEDRGTKDIGWLISKFSFSFSSYYHPLKNGFGLLITFNDDIVKPGGGFGNGNGPGGNGPRITFGGPGGEQGGFGFKKKFGGGGDGGNDERPTPSVATASPHSTRPSGA